MMKEITVMVSSNELADKNGNQLPKLGEMLQEILKIETLANFKYRADDGLTYTYYDLGDEE